MSWNYRVVRHVGSDETYWRICDVYYDDDGEPDGLNEGSIAHALGGTSEVAIILGNMVHALSRPVLTFNDLKQRWVTEDELHAEAQAALDEIEAAEEPSDE